MSMRGRVLLERVQLQFPVQLEANLGLDLCVRQLEALKAVACSWETQRHEEDQWSQNTDAEHVRVSEGL